MPGKLACLFEPVDRGDILSRVLAGSFSGRWPARKDDMPNAEAEAKAIQVGCLNLAKLKVTQKSALTLEPNIFPRALPQNLRLEGARPP